MEIVKVATILVADNDNRPPGVVPMPARSFTGEISAEGHAEFLRMLADAPFDGEIS